MQKMVCITGIFMVKIVFIEYDDTTKTELIDQYDKKITVEANEGDVVIFLECYS